MVLEGTKSDNMEFNVEQVEHNLNEYKELSEKLKKLQLQNVYLLNIKNLGEYEEQIEKCDREISLLGDRLEKLNNEYNNSSSENSEQILSELKNLKQQYETLTKKSEILYDAWDLKTKIKELENIIVRSTLQPVAKKKNEDIHSLLAEAKDMEELKVFIDAVCISFYKVPLLVALITKDPSEIESDFQVSGLSQELRDKVIGYIEHKKVEIVNNLILSDKALIDLIEHTTGRNITNQQRHNERVDTGFNSQFNGQILLERGENYALLRHQQDWDKATAGTTIKRFNDMGGSKQFDRKDSDMLVRNYPDAASEDLIYRSFKSMPNERKRILISAIISNLELCYEMFQSYYLSDKVEIPVLINLTNGKSFHCKFEEHNLPHILGVPGTHGYNKTTQSYYLELPQATLDMLELTRGGALNILKKIVGKDENGEPYKNKNGVPYKNIIIEQCGLNYDSATHSYYEMLPWEKIILKTNAFIRGDFFKTTSLISPINPNSFLVTVGDEIKKISITPTRFEQSAINQKLLDPNIPFDEAVQILRSNKSLSDFTFKGMIYDKGLWIPKTNVSAIGERINPHNASTLKTLEKYRYLISGITDPSEGGFVASVESLKDDGLSKEYSVQEMLTSLIEIANSFATTEEIEYNLRTYLEQLQQVYTDTKSNVPKK